MGAYENPLAVIDTESSKIWANAITNIGNTTVELIERNKAELSRQQKEAQLILQQNAKYVMDNQAEFSMQMAKNGTNNPFLFKAGKEVIDKMARANAAVLAAKTQEEQQIALNEYGLLQSSYTNLVTGIKQGADADKTYLEDITNQENPATKQGGMATSKKGYSTYQKIMSIRTGFGKGAIEEYIDNGNGTWNTRFSGGILGDEIIDMPQSEAFNFDPGIVPPVDKELTELLYKGSGENADGSINSILNKNGTISDQYLMGQKIVMTEPDANGNSIQSIVKEADTAKIISTLRGDVGAIAEAYLQDYDAANSIWLEVFGSDVSKSNPLARGENGIGVSVEDQKRFTEALYKRMENKVAAYNITDTTEMPYKQTISSKIVNVLSKNPSGKPNIKFQNAQIVGNTIYKVADDLGFLKNKAGVIIGGTTIDIDNPNFATALNELGYQIEAEAPGGVKIKQNGGTKTAEILDGENLDTFILKITGVETASKAEAQAVLNSIKQAFTIPSEKELLIDYGANVINQPNESNSYEGFIEN